MTVLFLCSALAFTGCAVFFLCKANNCACEKAGQCSNPVNHYWLSAIVCSVISLGLCCAIMHTEVGTLIWLLMMASCLAGAYLSIMQQKRKRCSKTKSATGPLINAINLTGSPKA